MFDRFPGGGPLGDSTPVRGGPGGQRWSSDSAGGHSRGPGKHVDELSIGQETLIHLSAFPRSTSLWASVRKDADSRKC